MSTLRTIAIIAFLVTTCLGVKADELKHLQFDLLNTGRHLENDGLQPVPYLPPTMTPENWKDPALKERNFAASASVFMAICTTPSEAAAILCRGYVSGFSQAWLMANLMPKGQSSFKLCTQNITYENILNRMTEHNRGTMWQELPPNRLVQIALLDILAENGCKHS